MFGRTQIREGMTVRSSDGEKLGKVFAVGEDSFHVEKGLFFPKDYLCRFSDVTDVRDGELILASGRDALRDTQANADTSFGMGRSSDTSTLGSLDTGRPASSSSESRRLESDREVAIPVAREELDVVKREREAGQVRITKEVVSEEQEVNVPVRKERVRVERREVDPARPAMNASFKDETIVVPLREEEVDVRKRVVSEGEVVIHKDAVEEERRVAETVRREQVDVRTEGDVDETERSRSGFKAPDDDPLKRY
jgi:uncharacterized protein (TIGR02271 family)